MKLLLLLLSLVSVLVVFVESQQKLVWSQEFNGGSLDKEYWTYERGNDPGGNPGWGNRELEYYTNRDDNCRIEGDSLIIQANREAYGGFQFTSARIKTQGKMEFKYGTLETRMRLPQIGKGLWPAFWLLGASSMPWPKCGEIDIMEAGAASAINSGIGSRFIQSTCHWWDYGGNHQADYGQSYTAPNDLNNDFHVYKMVWDNHDIQTFVDDVKVYDIDISNPTNGIEAFHQNYFILLNLAVGGNYPGIYDPNQIDAPFPARLEFDYIRLYQNPTDELYINGQRVNQ